MFFCVFLKIKYRTHKKPLGVEIILYNIPNDSGGGGGEIQSFILPLPMTFLSKASLRNHVTCFTLLVKLVKYTSWSSDQVGMVKEVSRLYEKGVDKARCR